MEPTRPVLPFVPNPQANAVLERLDRLTAATKRREHLVLLTVAGNGRTMLLHQFAKRHLPSDENERSVVYFHAPYVKSEAALFNGILAKLNVLLTLHRESSDRKREQIVTLLKNLKTKVLVVDDAENLMGRWKSQPFAGLNPLRNVAIECNLSLVAASCRSFNIEPDEDGRADGYSIVRLPRWPMDETFAAFATDLAQAHGLDLRSPRDRSIIFSRLHALSEGVTGELTHLMDRIVESKEPLTLEGLDRLGWLPPSERWKDIHLE